VERAKHMKRLELGVFLPIAKNGFVKSTNAPAYIPSYRENLQITLLAEEIGLDYVFSMLKWRGFGGATQFWDSSFDSFSLMAALAAATSRIDLIATVNPVLHHPTSMAKMAATIQDVSGGRLGLNLITGSTLGEYTQMGVLPPEYDRRRYDYAAEWVRVLKRLWSEPSVTHDGEYFHLDNCVSEPKPQPRPFLVCAGTSDEGLRFTIREADYSFLGASGVAGLKAVSVRAHEIAAAEGATIKTATPVLLMIGDSKADAEAQWEYLLEGADVEANVNNAAAYTASTRTRNQVQGAQIAAQPRRVSSQQPILGGPREVADQLIEIASEGQLDNICMVFPEYIEGLKRFGRDVLPILRERFEIGVRGDRPLQATAAAE
jgi:pyrimidine oxygenase